MEIVGDVGEIVPVNEIILQDGEEGSERDNDDPCDRKPPRRKRLRSLRKGVGPAAAGDFSRWRFSGYGSHENGRGRTLDSQMAGTVNAIGKK